MIGVSGPGMMMRGFGPDSSLTQQKIKPGTVRRILPYAKPYRLAITVLLILTALEACVTVATPVLFKYLIDDGILPRDRGIVIGLSCTVAGLALLEALLTYTSNYASAKISEGLIYDLRTQVFDHVQRQPLAFFTRAQTGALVSRLNTDVVSAQQAVSTLLSTMVGAVLSLALVLGTMIYLSWQISLIAFVLLPLFVMPGKVVGRRLQRLTRESMQQNAEMGSLMNERFNVSGALLSKLYGRPKEESRKFATRAARVRDIAVVTGVFGRVLFLTVTLLGSLATAIAYGVGGSLVVSGALEIGTLVALATLLTRLFGPINQLSNVQANVMTALVSFDRLFEVLDLKPLIRERPGAVALPTATPGHSAPDIEFDRVSFRYPSATEVSLASLESIALPTHERINNVWTLRELSFRAPAGKLTALVGPSGAGKTTITHLVPRLYDPVEGTVRIGGVDVRDVTLDALRNTVGMVTQDAHLFHETIRQNLMYARPEAEERDVIEACKAAQIWDLISSLPDGLDTVVGDRGYRLSGGEKQRIAMARLLLKAPPVVVLDEATAHLDSESEAAVQRALSTALAGRTSLVIAHRLSTIRDADQILVIEAGRVKESGVHEELLEAGGLYAELYRTQFSRQSLGNGGRGAGPDGGPAEPVPVHGGPPLGGFFQHGPQRGGPGGGPMNGPGIVPRPGMVPGPGMGHGPAGHDGPVRWGSGEGPPPGH
jgi:ATP-binding cassette subfamily B protein